MSETEARAARDAAPDEGSAGESYTPPRTSKHRTEGADEDTGAADEPEGTEHPPEPSWWHRSHPTFAGLLGFFSGVLYVIAVPGIYAAVLSWLLSTSRAQALFPLIVVALIVPIGMLVPRRTRRFAQFMLLGVVSTAVVVAATAALVLLVLVKTAG